MMFRNLATFAVLVLFVFLFIGGITLGITSGYYGALLQYIGITR